MVHCSLCKGNVGIRRKKLPDYITTNFVWTEENLTHVKYLLARLVTKVELVSVMREETCHFIISSLFIMNFLCYIILFFLSSSHPLLLTNINLFLLIILWRFNGQCNLWHWLYISIGREGYYGWNALPAFPARFNQWLRRWTFFKVTCRRISCFSAR